jgi:hypothetical protein
MNHRVAFRHLQPVRAAKIGLVERGEGTPNWSSAPESDPIHHGNIRGRDKCVRWQSGRDCISRPPPFDPRSRLPRITSGAGFLSLHSHAVRGFRRNNKNVPSPKTSPQTSKHLENGCAAIIANVTPMPKQNTAHVAMMNLIAHPIVKGVARLPTILERAFRLF